MKLHRVQIENFRNFRKLDILLGQHVVVIGENKVGKSNLLHALRLVLDPSLPDSARHLRMEDFWDGLPRPLTSSDRICISVELGDFENNASELALLAEHLVEADPMISRLTYVFQPAEGLDGDPQGEGDYEFIVYGGDRPENRVDYLVRRRLPLDVMPAMRDAASDLLNQRRSPLSPLLDRVVAQLESAELEEIAEKVQKATEEVTDLAEIAELTKQLDHLIHSMVGSSQALQASLGFSSTDPERLVRALRLFIDDGTRGIAEASLGSANVLYVAMRLLDLQSLVAEKTRDHTFLAIEEPEAHIHPHLQRSIFKSFLSPRAHHVGDKKMSPPETSIILTTHSPHIASVAPLESIVLLRSTAKGTKGHSAHDVELTEAEIRDLERYIDVTRGEILFSRGVLLVEGDAELYLLPVLARECGIELDQLGISVCSVSGTNFLPYVRLLDELGIPNAVITDYDWKDDKSLGETRVLKLLNETVSAEDLPKTRAKQLESAPEYGFFLNESTLETEIWDNGRPKAMSRTLIDLAPGDTAKKRAEGWLEDTSSVDRDQLMKDVNAVGKGRYAQRLAARIKDGKKRYP
jgi:putative ATP-dependent endonuclease of OLD family